MQGCVVRCCLLVLQLVFQIFRQICRIACRLHRVCLGQAGGLEGDGSASAPPAGRLFFRRFRRFRFFHGLRVQGGRVFRRFGCRRVFRLLGSFRGARVVVLLFFVRRAEEPAQAAAALRLFRWDLVRVFRPFRRGGLRFWGRFRRRFRGRFRGEERIGYRRGVRRDGLGRRVRIPAELLLKEIHGGRAAKVAAQILFQRRQTLLLAIAGGTLAAEFFNDGVQLSVVDQAHLCRAHGGGLTACRPGRGGLGLGRLFRRCFRRGGRGRFQCRFWGGVCRCVRHFFRKRICRGRFFDRFRRFR